MPVVKRTVAELVELHRRLGNKHQEIFVEGRQDKQFYAFYLESAGVPNVAVLEIQTVEIPTAEVITRGLKDGNRGRVVALAALLQGRVSQSEVVCIADADSDHLLQVTYPYELLLLTDFSCLEMYCFNAHTIGKILTVQDFPKGATQVIADLSTVLREVFLIRIAAEILGE